MQHRPGDLLGGKYRIVRLIGDGGMGAVYEARHEVLGTPVALKFLHGELAKRQGLVARFTREAQVSARIQSPHVTRVTDVDRTADGSAYIVMELLSGESLQQVLDRNVKLPRDRAVDYALQILSGLEAAHAFGVVHRDLKPDNVYITPSTGGPVVKLLDFGIAKVRESSEYKKGLTRPGAIMGTPEYMAPEQAYAADQVDHTADIYSLGAILYEMLTGERPAYGDDARAIVEQVTAGKVRRLTDLDPTIPSGLAAVVHQAIDPVSTRRFASAMEMRRALAAFAGELSHAGRLAAAPAPAVPAAPERGPVRAGTPPTVDEEPLVPPSTVPRTLPPEAEAPSTPAEGPTALATPIAAAGASPAEPPRGATQEAPREMLSAISAAMPVGSVPQAARQGALFGVAEARRYQPPPPVARRPSRMIGGVLALLLGILVTGGVIVLVAYRGDSDDGRPPPLTLPPPRTTISPQNPTVDEPPLEPDEPRATAKPRRHGAPVYPRPRPAHRPDAAARPRDAGGPKRDAGAPSPTPGIPLPPGFASAIPPGFPTAIPPLFPLPGFGQPAPKSSGR